MTQCREATKSPVKNSDGSWDRTFLVADVSDAAQALGLAAGAASTTFFGCKRADVPDMRPFGYSLWEVIYHYDAPTSPAGEEAKPPGDEGTGNQDDLDAVLEFDTSGGTSHITQCISQSDFGAEAGTQLKDSKVIGASGDSVEGTDIVVPKLVLSLARRPPNISGNYIKSIAGLTGKTNEGPYIIRGQVLGVYCEVQFDDGELMFMGAAPTGKEVWKDGRFVYKWEASANRGEISLGNGLDGEIKVPGKKGWEYLWMMFKKKELTTPPVAIPVPHIAFVAKLQESKTFAQVLGF